MNMPPASDLLFITVKISFVNELVALSVVRFFLQPCCSEPKILYLVKCLISLSIPYFSPILEKDIENEISL